ncbi:MAG TPA: diguanylate cyclase [Xanthobacteraceae bacterium]|jgi:diguanylate cyclase (GGDEF)-like protein|nr:diguanylate cyclase [Xanthobacteraceae bacterium]
MKLEKIPGRHMVKTTSPRLSIRARVMLLALLAVVPLTLDRVRLLEGSRTERIEMTSKEVLDLAKRGAGAQVEMIDATRAVLAVVARAYATLAHGGQDCATFLAGFAIDVPWIRTLSVVGPDDRIICSTRPRAVGLDVSDRPYIQDARRSWGFVLSDYLIERTTNQPAVMAAYPTLGKDENVNAIIVAAIDLQWVGRLSPLVEARAGATALLLDRNGTVLAEFPQQLKRGQNFADHPLFREVFSRFDGGVTAAGFDGVRRIFAFTRLAGTDARILIGLDEAEALRRIDREIGIAYLQLALFGILTLLAAWYGGEQLIVEPIRALARTAARIGRGDLDARPNGKKLAPEFVPLAAALTDMAIKLAERERDLRSANRHLEALASIDGLSGLANRRSFDARLQAEWERAASLKRPVALMMIDVDHFKLFNDNYGHLEGDQCLRVIAETLSAATSQSGDLAARYGGEEFVLLLPDTNLAAALEIAGRLRHTVAALAIAHRFAPCGHVTVSIGVASLTPTVASDPQALIEAADSGLYAAKRKGRNTVWAAQDAMTPAA